VHKTRKTIEMSKKRLPAPGELALEECRVLEYHHKECPLLGGKGTREGVQNGRKKLAYRLVGKGHLTLSLGGGGGVGGGGVVGGGGLGGGGGKSRLVSLRDAEIAPLSS